MITLIKDGEIWRSRDPHKRYAPEHGAARLVLEKKELVWVEDARQHLELSREPHVVGPPHLRSFVGAPIRLDDGTTPGVLAVYDVVPRPFDAALAARLEDLAAFVAEDWTRAVAKEAREQARKERDILTARFNAVVQAMPVSLVIIDRNYTVVGSSPRWAEEVGSAPEAVLGRPLYDLVPGVKAKWGTFLERVLAGETFTAERVRMVRPRDGAVRWNAVEMAPWRDLDGQVGGMVVSIHDITSTVDALEAAERSEERLKLALEIADVHVWELDYRAKELVKAGAEATFFDNPLTYGDLVSDIYGTIDPRDRPAAEAAWRRHEETGEPYRAEYRTTRADAREVWTSGACRLVKDEAGRPVRLIGALQNITERKAAERALLVAKEEAETANRAKTSFLATMSHEIRTPLNGVLGMAQAMAADALSPAQRERLDVVRRSGETLLTILNNILDLSKIEAGKLEVEETDFDLGELAETARRSFAEIARQRGLALDLEIAPAARGTFRGDSTRILQILHNLILNALKFTERGGVRLSIDPSAEGLRFAVCDTGIGIPAEGLERLFQKFEQMDASTTRRHGGTGLGLAICRELSQALGGEITVVSEPGRGSTFTLTAPLTRIGEEARRSADAAPLAPAETATPLRVLAAEDNTVNQLVLKTLLNQAGVDPFIVSDGLEALEAWRQREWDVILMDVQMPNLDGPSATRRIRAEEVSSGRRRTPILALTANAMSHQIPAYEEAGMNGFVAKPIRVAELFQALEDAVAPAGEARAA